MPENVTDHSVALMNLFMHQNLSLQNVCMKLYHEYIFHELQASKARQIFPTCLWWKMEVFNDPTRCFL